MEPAHISGFCSVKRMRVFDSPLDGTLIHRRLAPKRFSTHLSLVEMKVTQKLMLVLIYLPGRMES